MAITQVTVTGTINDVTGRPASGGQIVWQLSEPIRDGAGLFVNDDAQAVPLVSGTFSIELYATNDPTTEPAGAYYIATFQIGSQQWQDEYVIPYDAPDGTVNVAALVPLNQEG